MKMPRYTDGRYPHGYKPAAQTDIRKTFARIKAAIKQNAEEAAVKVAPLKRASK